MRKSILFILFSFFALVANADKANTHYPRKIVMEEATGTWCGWCVRGIETIERVSKEYPDNFIGIGLHSGDAMDNPVNYSPITSKFRAYPNCIFNRNSNGAVSVDYYSAKQVVEQYKDNAIAKITSKAVFADSEKSQVKVSTESTFGFSENGASYRIAYVVLEDKVGPYMQNNAYANNSGYDNPSNYMYNWVHKSSPTEVLFNDVARGIFGSADGVDGSIPNSLTEGVAYSYDYVFTLPTNIINKDNIRIVVLLLDGNTGEIVNADQSSVTTDENVNATAFSFYYGGAKLSDGSTVTINAKEDDFGTGEMTCDTNPANDPKNGLILSTKNGSYQTGTATIEITKNTLAPNRIQWCMGGECVLMTDKTYLEKDFQTDNTGVALVQFDAAGIQNSGTLVAKLTAKIGNETHVVNINFVYTKSDTPDVVNVTAPTAKSGLIYNGSAQELIAAGSTSKGVMQYSLDGSSYNTAIPKGTDAKTYTVYYKAVDGNKDLTTAASLTVTISPKTVSSPTITLSTTSFVYDGQEKKPTVTVKDGNATIPASEYTVSYSNNINVGTATVTIKDKDGGNYVVSGSAQFTITPAAANVTAPKAKSGLVYNGNAQELITAGSSDAGEMQYSLDGSNYSTAIPKGTDAKTYTVYYRVKGDANHSDVAPATLTATISPKTVSNPTITLSETSFVYDGKEKKPTVTVKDGNTTIPASEYTVSYSNNINVGTATVTITDNEGGNYIVSGTASFEIEQATINVIAPAAVSGLVYNGYAQELITSGSTSVGKMLYSLDDVNYYTVVPAERVAKTYTVYYKVTDEMETTDLVASASLNVTISKAPLKISVGNYTITEGDQIPEFELQYDGFKNYETKDVLTKKPSVSCNATANSAPGRYEIIVSGAEAQNYDISYQSGWLTIEIAQGILDVVTDGQPFDVYNTQGRKVRSGVTSLKGLPKGVYIVNGKKVIK